MSNFNFVESGAILIRPTTNSFVQSVLQAPETQTWTLEDYSNCYSYEPVVPKGTWEFKAIHKLFYGTSGGLKLQKVKRVQNPYLMGEFLLKKEELMADDDLVKVEKLFHGTKRDSLDGIVCDGFDWRLHGENRGVRFGNGVNFTPNAGFADNFGDRGRSRRMILAYVLVGRKCAGSEGMVLPPDGYDTTIKPGGNVVVKYDDGEYYPAYIIHYYSPAKNN